MKNAFTNMKKSNLILTILFLIGLLVSCILVILTLSPVAAFAELIFVLDLFLEVHAEDEERSSHENSVKQKK